MGIKFLTFGSPETSRSLNELAMELAYAMGRSFNLESAAAAKPDIIVLAITAVAPFRGTLSNRTSFKRADSEFWSLYNIEFEKYAFGDACGKLEAMAAALIGAIHQIPNGRMSTDEKHHFEAAVADGVALLLSEPDRVRRFQRPLLEG